MSDPARSEQGNLAALERDIAAESIDFAFLYWPDLDGLLHRVGNRSPAVGAKLREYEHRLRDLLETAWRHYREVRLYVFSDHGMANCDELLDLRARLAQLPVRMPRDYAVVLDSTMARFWFFNERARDAVTACLRQVSCGSILPDAELARLGTLFPDRYFGELIFLVQEGVLIVPSDMGERPIRAMHGYHPAEPHSYAALLTNVPDLPAGITDIPHLHRLMTDDAVRAHGANRLELQQPEVVPAA